jgi:predicted nucleic acid-binding protein
VTDSVVVDASAGVEIILATDRGRRLARLVPREAILWVPAHFFSEVFASIRYLHVVAGKVP